MLIEYVSNHEVMHKSAKFTPTVTLELKNKMWNDFKNLLNKVPGGAVKDTEQWKRAYGDIMVKAKKKTVENQKSLRQTSGGPPELKNLDSDEETLVNLIPKVSVTGNDSVKESIIKFNNESKDVEGPAVGMVPGEVLEEDPENMKNHDIKDLKGKTEVFGDYCFLNETTPVFYIPDEAVGEANMSSISGLTEPASADTDWLGNVTETRIDLKNETITAPPNLAPGDVIETEDLKKVFKKDELTSSVATANDSSNPVEKKLKPEYQKLADWPRRKSSAGRQEVTVRNSESLLAISENELATRKKYWEYKMDVMAKAARGQAMQTRILRDLSNKLTNPW